MTKLKDVPVGGMFMTKEHLSCVKIINPDINVNKQRANAFLFINRRNDAISFMLEDTDVFY